jgi:hypothetical protein
MTMHFELWPGNHVILVQCNLYWEWLSFKKCPMGCFWDYQDLLCSEINWHPNWCYCFHSAAPYNVHPLNPLLLCKVCTNTIYYIFIIIYKNNTLEGIYWVLVVYVQLYMLWQHAQSEHLISINSFYLNSFTVVTLCFKAFNGHIRGIHLKTQFIIQGMWNQHYCIYT